MRKSPPPELRVGVDVGCHSHNVAIGLSTGEILEEFSIHHDPEGFRQFFSRIEEQERKHELPVAVAMEGYNGYARPLDTLVRARNYRLFNINNLKLARFKEIFPGAAKTDEIDARKALELFQLRDLLPVAKDVLQEVRATPQENDILKRLSRRRRRLVNERVRVLNNLQADLQSVCPGLLEITGEAANLWFLRFLTSTDDLRKLARLRESTIHKIPGIGTKYTNVILKWQKRAQFSHEAEWVSEMILDDAARVLELHQKIDHLEQQMETVAGKSDISRRLSTIPGFGPITTAELAGEIGTVERFESESSLALYLGMSNLDDSSGKHKGSKPPKHVNERAKAAMMIAVDRHRKKVPQSETYYEKKRAEGKKHNQSVRAPENKGVTLDKRRFVTFRYLLYFRAQQTIRSNPSFNPASSIKDKESEFLTKSAATALASAPGLVSPRCTIQQRSVRSCNGMPPSFLHPPPSPLPSKGGGAKCKDQTGRLCATFIQIIRTSESGLSAHSAVQSPS